MAASRSVTAVLFLLTLSLGADAARFTGVVTSVTDGDTIWVRPEVGGPSRPVRLEGIDAPEICQPFGAQSRDALASLVLRRRVVINDDTMDENKRIVSRVRLKRQDVGEWMVVRGYAWSYRFRGNLGPYAREEKRARAARVGLWKEGEPIAPREFRVKNGSCRRVK